MFEILGYLPYSERQACVNSCLLRSDATEIVIYLSSSNLDTSRDLFKYKKYGKEIWCPKTYGELIHFQGRQLLKIVLPPF